MLTAWKLSPGAVATALKVRSPAAGSCACDRPGWLHYHSKPSCLAWLQLESCSPCTECEVR